MCAGALAVGSFALQYKTVGVSGRHLSSIQLPQGRVARAERFCRASDVAAEKTRLQRPLCRMLLVEKVIKMHFGKCTGSSPVFFFYKLISCMSPFDVATLRNESTKNFADKSLAGE